MHTDFLLSHWHCILPVIGIIVAGIFLSDKPREQKKGSDHHTGYISVPIFPKNKTVDATNITISGDFLAEAKGIFANWKKDY